MCVSRRLLSADTYRNLALARQGGNHVEAGLTFVAEDEDDGDGGEEGVGEGNGVAKEGVELAAAAAAVPGGGAVPGAELGNDDGGDESTDSAPKLEPGTGGGGGGSGSPEGAEEEEDDLYGDLYGGLEEDGGGADVDTVNRGSGGAGIGNGAGGDGGGSGEDVNGAGGLDGGGVAEAGAGAAGDGMAEDVSTRAVMNALKVREKQGLPHHFSRGNLILEWTGLVLVGVAVRVVADIHGVSTVKCRSSLTRFQAESLIHARYEIEFGSVLV